MRRTTALPAVVLAALAAVTLTSCQDDTAGTAAPAPSATAAATTAAAPSAAATTPAAPSTPAVPGAFDPEKALAEADKAPYAVTITTTTEAAGQPVLTMVGRSNLNTVFTGRLEMRTVEGAPADQAMWIETVTTADANYVRNRKGGGGWMKMPRTADNVEANYADYAKLLLAQGPAARKGMEQQGGVATYHLTGKVELEQMAAIDPRTYRSMKSKGVTGFDCDQWIDAKGRTVRFEQRMELRGVPSANKVVFTEFGPAETFAAPTAG